MFQSVSNRIINKLIDWLIALLVVAMILWFALTQPVLNDNKKLNTQTVDVEKLKSHVQLLTGGYAPRTLNYDNLNSTADYIYRQFQTVGIPEYQLISTISRQYRNVSIQIGPDTDEVYVIGAHYDAEDDSIDSEGNASGIATLIELARHLAVNSNKIDIGVILVAYPLSLNQSDSDIETGSYVHAKSLKKKNMKIRLMVSLDSVGQKEIDTIRNKHPYKFMELLHPKKENSTQLVGRLKDYKHIRKLKQSFNNSSTLALSSYNFPESFNKTHSRDHINYWRHGYPAVLISDYLYNDRNIVDPLATRDDPIKRLDYKKMADLVNGLFQVIVKTQTDIENKTQLAQQVKDKKSKALIQ